MLENEHDDDLDPTGDDGSGGDSIVRMSRKDIRALEKKGKAYDALVEEKARLERDLAFARAGVDTSTEEGAFFARGYDGELDPAAIRAAAERFNILAPKHAPPITDTDDTDQGPRLEPGEAELTDARLALSRGAAGDTGLDTDPYEEAQRIGQKMLADGAKFEHAFGAAINFLANRAENGDQRVIIDRRSVQALG